MRRTRQLFLLAIVLIVGGVWASYRIQKGLQARSTPPSPPKLNKGVQASSSDWVYFKGDGDRPVVEVRARDMERVEEPTVKVFLKGVQLKLYHKNGKEYDNVKSESAQFDEATGTLYSDGDVDITLAVPVDEQEKKGRLLNIRSSGVKIISGTGKVSTDRKTEFAFDLGNGQAVGADYDPQTRELQLHSGVMLHWNGSKPGQKPMDIEAGKLSYRESESKVYLAPWAKFRRDQLTLESANAAITLEDGNIRLVDAQRAHGVDKYPNRRLAFSAREMQMLMTEKSQIEKLSGAGDAKLQAVSTTAQTNIQTNRIDLDFEVTEDGSLLKTALANGASVIESKPIARPGEKTAATRVLKSDAITTKMRPGGEEIESMETAAAGTLELIPNEPTQPRRHMQADRIWMTYGAKNQLKSFRAVQVATRTNKPPAPKQKGEVPPALTWSKDLTADFDEQTGDMTKLEQWNDFRYQEGDRQATAKHATLDSKANLITLNESARTWDATGSVTADRIVMQQNSGDFTAEGNVASTRMPDKKNNAGGGMLAQDEPVQAKAKRMVSRERNQHVVYEGGATLWQSGNRLQSDTVTINRKDKSLAANGQVVSQLLDQKTDPKTGKRIVTIVRAPAMKYDDQARLAHYTGGVRLLREGMDVKAAELRAWLNESKPDQPKKDNDSSLNRMVADGAVEIFQTAEGRSRRSNSEHAEYYVAEDKVLLNGGIAQMVDSVKGTSRGKQIVYYSRNDNIQIEGAISQPVVSKIRRN